MNIQIISRKEAISQGLKRYFTGEPCKRGHIAERFIWNSGCIDCDSLIRNKIEKTYYAKNGERIRKKKKPYQDAYREKNRDKINAQKCEHYKINRERIRKEQKEYLLKNPDVIIAGANNRRARKIGNGGSHTSKQSKELLEKQNYKCVNCRCCLKKNKKHLDHIMPLALGGTNNIDNVQWLCAKCNLSKKSKDPIKWAQQNGRLL